MIPVPPRSTLFPYTTLFRSKLSLDDDIHKYLPDVPDFGKPITIAHLLHHTSGLRDWPETLSLSGVDMEGPITLDRKSTRLNSSHANISYAVFCLKKKNKKIQ